MRKLNPFQMPQINNENVPVASTSDTNPCDDCLDKHVLNESLHELQARNVGEVLPPCSSNPDLFNIVLSEQQQNIDLNRPRQYGRRSDLLRISSYQIDSSDNGSAVRKSKRDLIMDEVLIWNRCSVSLPITSKNGARQARLPRLNEFQAFTGRARVYPPSQVHWPHHETLRPFPSFLPPDRQASPTQLRKQKFGRVSWREMMTTTMRAKAVKVPNLCGRIRWVDQFAVCSALWACSTFHALLSFPFTSEVIWLIAI